MKQYKVYVNTKCVAIYFAPNKKSAKKRYLEFCKEQGIECKATCIVTKRV